MNKIIATFFDNIRDTVAKPVRLTFADLAEVMAQAASVPISRAHKSDAMCVVPASFAPARRARANVVERFAFTGDVDGGKPADPGFDGMVSRLDAMGLAYIAHTTTKSRHDANRYRVILPFAVPLSASDAEAASSSIHLMFGSIFDAAALDAARLSILPANWFGVPEEAPDWHEEASHHGFRYRDGEPADARAIMEAHPPLACHERLDEDDPSLTVIFAQGSVAVDPSELTDLDRSPLVTASMVTDYLAAPRGGRFYRFLCRLAARALAINVACDAESILSLAMKMNFRAGNHRRPNARREAHHALQFAASRHIEPEKSDRRVERTIERLRRRRRS